eukprot:TRINITY_DN19217_c0_g1_i1.p1 TRINITY_DN19217_c0_g1~~TRINITY_DN19217_c0_g1_i1.p1  ORF type:complete len:538 (+),score=151.86 TRINITY_DN19217_c0_g1_i1:53-1615(+)
MRDADLIFELIGKFGRYQFLVVTWGCLASFVAGLHAMSTFYLTMDVTGECTGEDCVDSGPDAWCYNTTHARTMLMEFEGCDPSSWKGAFVGSTFFLGWFFGVTVFGRFTDLYGRHRSAAALTILMFPCLPLGAQVTSIYMYYGLSFVHGIIIGGISLISYVLTLESIHSENAALAGTTIMCVYGLGCASLSPIAYLFPDWRDFSYAATVAGFPILPVTFWLEESPRWLAADGRTQEAADCFARIAKFNGYEYDPAFDAATPLPGVGEHKVEPRFLDLFSFPEVRKRTFVQTYNWFVCSAAYYGLNYAAGDLGGDVYVNAAVISLVEVPTYILQGILVENPAMARRRTTMAAFLVGSLGCVAYFLFDLIGVEEGGRVFAFLGKAGVTCAFAIQYIWGSELFPTDVRMSGVGFADGVARVGALLSPLAVKTNANATLVAVAVACVGGSALSSLLPETRGEEPLDTLDELRRDVHRVHSISVSEGSAIQARTVKKNDRSSIAGSNGAPARNYQGCARNSESFV